MTFSSSAQDFLRVQSDAAQRQVSWEAFAEAGLPTTSDEVWRYAPLKELDMESFEVATSVADVELLPLAASLASRGEIIVRVVDGHLISVTGEAEGLTISCVPPVFDERYRHDGFALAALALSPGVVTVSVAPGAQISTPILILTHVRAGAVFPMLRVEVGRGGAATVLDYLDGGDDSLVVPVGEFLLSDGAALTLGTYQRLATSAWHIARTTAQLGRDAHFRQAVISVGAHYNRSRNDADLAAPGASNELRTTYLGDGNQVHDYRTRQFHTAARTTSTLLSKGAVADESRSVYTGLIEIEKGAKRTDARQTNHNLLLSPHAHADSVPNLDIRENDVMCAHASSVGPLDELQRWYLESRGVPRAIAERLMIQGFFYEMLATLPKELTEAVESDLSARLSQLEVVSK